MKCTQVKKALASRSLGFLAPQESEALQLHLVACKDCCETARRFELACAALQQPQAEGELPYLADRVMSRVQTQNRAPRKPGLTWLLPVAFSMTAVLIIAFLTPVFRTSTVSMTKQEVFDAYKQDMQELGIYQTNEEQISSESFDYEEYGIPSSISQLMI